MTASTHLCPPDGSEPLGATREFRTTPWSGYEGVDTVYAVLRNQQHYRDPGINYEQLHVERNAPRWLAQLRKFGYVSEPAASARPA